MYVWKKGVSSVGRLSTHCSMDLIGRILTRPDIILPCRRRALQLWKNKQAFKATYGNLLKVFREADHNDGVKAVLAVLRKKGKALMTFIGVFF